MLRHCLLVWTVFNCVFCYTFYEKPWRPELFHPEDTLNPQGWASHNIRDIHPEINNEYESYNKETAMLPSLLMKNPRAKTVFDNLSFFANPQFVVGPHPAQSTNSFQRFDVPQHFRRFRRIRRRPIAFNRPKKREALMATPSNKVTIGLMKILRQAILDFKRRNYAPTKEYVPDKQFI